MKNRMPHYHVVLLSLLAGVAFGEDDSRPGNDTHKPRIINTTDLGADPDDEQSMVRQLVCANEFDIEGLIVSTGCWKKKQSDTKMLDKLVDAYAECYDNLKVHADGFPTVEYLRSISVMGQKGYGMSDIGDGKDSPGSELIIASVDKDDPRPVWVGAWGGANNVAQAIWKVRATRSKEEFDKFLSKLRVFDILGQDDAGAWITKNFPEVLYIRAVKVYGWQPPKNGDYQRKDIQSHGPLGAVYPDTKWATEGDTPAFMHVYPNGLNDPDQIDQGGWGGRFSWKKQVSIKSMRAVKQEERRYDPYEMYGNTPDGTSAIKRWSKGYNNDFAARMDWSITGKYEDANHHPVAIVNGDKSRRVLQVSAAPGEKVKLSAEGSSDPDKDALTYAWSFYDEPSSYDGSVEIANQSGTTATVSVPSNAAGKNLHIILQLHDDGEPNLYAYRRVIINVSGTAASSTGSNAEEPVAGSPYSPLPKKVVVTKVKHFGNMCWKIAAAGGTWYFENGETDGKSGFSSAFDQAGNDWIGNDADKGFNKSPSRGGRHEYRGWPNFGEGNFDHPQRKSGAKTRWVDARGNHVDFNGKLEGDHLMMRSANANYELEYHFFPSHAAIKVLKATKKYAFLFEGPIGGEQEASVDKDYYVLKDGKHRECKSGGLGYLEPEFGNDFPSPFFYLADSDSRDPQVWYAGVKNAGPESAGDEGWRQGQNMVIFSFGRDQDKRAYTGTDAVCVFGFHPKGDHGAISEFIESRLTNPFAQAAIQAVAQSQIAATAEPASKTPTPNIAGPNFNKWLKEYVPTRYSNAEIDDHGGWTQARIPNLKASRAEWEPGILLKQVHDIEEGESIFVSKSQKEDWPESDSVVYHQGAGYYIAGYDSATMSEWNVGECTVIQFDGDSRGFAEGAAKAFVVAHASYALASTAKEHQSLNTWLKDYIASTYPDATLDDHGGWYQAHVGDLVVSWAEWNEPGLTLKGCEAHALKDGKSIFVSKNAKQDWAESDTVVYHNGAGYYIAGYSSAAMSNWKVEKSTILQFDGDAKSFTEKMAAAWSKAKKSNSTSSATQGAQATHATVAGKGFDKWLRGYIPKRYPDAEFDDHGGWAQARFPNLKASWAEWEPGILLKQVHDIEEGESIFVSKSQKEDWPESDSVVYHQGAGYYIAGYDSKTMADWNVGQCTVVQFDGDSKQFAEDTAKAFAVAQAGGNVKPAEVSPATSSQSIKRTGKRLRVVMTTDFPPIGVVKGGNVPNDQKSDPDDMQSIVRFLLYANEFDVEGLVVSSGTFANKVTKQNMLDVIDRYAMVYDNLKKHDPKYPTPDALRKVTFGGRSGTWGKKGTVNIGEGKDSEASDALIAIIDKPDPRPVYVGIWGDCSVVAQAVWKVQNTRSEAELDKFLSKLRIHQIATQDGTIGWLRENFPKLFIIHSHKTYQGMFGGRDPISNVAWVNKNIRKDHGPLCEIYPHEGMGCTGVCEGDSPAFLWLVSANRGLNDPDDPTQESWGGQFKKDGKKNHYIDGPGRRTISKWRKEFQKEFAQRADWCVK